MQDVGRRASIGAGWWSRLADGSIRRVWAHRAHGRYVCLREISTPAQEAARNRLAGAREDAAAEDVEHDKAIVAAIRFDILRTPDLFEAFAFLGGDSSAKSALRDANPRLSWRDFPD
jgi:hypothetical protein